MALTVLNQLARDTKPICSIVIAAFNAEHFISEAIYSLQTQTLSTIEIIVVDDGSNDRTAEIVSNMSRVDNRIRLIQLAHNQGQSSALNVGIKMARGKYTAFLDADDLAFPRRLELQVAAMELDKALILCGGALVTMHAPDNTEGDTWVYETCPETIPIKSLFKSKFMTGTLCLRTEMLFKHALFFNPALKIGSDWELTLRAMKHGKVINLPEKLIRYRIHSTQMTANLADDITTSSADIRRKQIEALGINPTDEEMMVHLAVSPCNYWAFGSHPYFTALGQRLPQLAKAWFTRLREANKNTGKYAENTFNLYLQELEQMISAHKSWT